MKKFIFTAAAVAALAVSAPAFAGCEGFDQDLAALEQIVHSPYAQASSSSSSRSAMFAKSFASKDGLRSWTETSTLGGGRIEERSMLGRDFIFAYRSYTSGVKSSDAAVYVQDENGQWQLIKAYPVVMGAFITAERRDDTFLFHPDNDAAKSLMVVTKADLKS